jgi:hypothetical protein
MAARPFTPEQIDIMHAAYETACEKLRIRPGGRAADHVAVMIVDLAATGVLDVDAITAALVLAADELTVLEKPESEILFFEQLAKFARVLP